MDNDIYKNIKKNHSKKPVIFICIFVLSLSAAIVAFFVMKNKSAKISYITQNPIVEDISQDVSATGSLSPTNTIEVGSEVSGTILEVLVDTNDKVKKGQILAKIDTQKLSQSVDNFAAQLDSAKAELYSAEVDLENKKWNYDNYVLLFESTQGKSPSKMQLKTSELAYKSALALLEIRKANIKQVETYLKSAQVDVQKAIIKSPTDGTILSRNVEPGQTVAASFSTPTLFEVAENLAKMKLESSVLEADIGKVKEGQEVDFSVDAYPNRTFRGKVDKVNFADSASTSTTSTTSSSNIISYTITTYIDNDELLLRPGMSATATIKTALSKDALVVPYQALLFKPNQNEAKKSGGMGIMMGMPKRERKSYSQIGQKGSIWILENGEPKELEVEIGISNGRYAQILSNNVNLEMQVIIQSQQAK